MAPLVIDLIRCTEKEAATKVKQEILTRVNKSGIGDGMRQGLCERRNRLMHDEWHVSVAPEPPQAIPMISRIVTQEGCKVVYDHPAPEHIWNLAIRFREQRSAFSAASRLLREHKCPCVGGFKHSHFERCVPTESG